MLRFLELAGEAVANTFRAVVDWVGDLFGGSSDPTVWTSTAWSVAGLGLLLLALVLLLTVASGRRRRRSLGPEMMMSHGEIVLVGEHDGGLVESRVDGSLDSRLEAPATGRYLLKLALSNLNPYPVQLLELSVRTARGTPVIAEAGAVVPPNGAVDVMADLFDLPVGDGVIELYLYTNKLQEKTFKFVAPLEWEPWAHRYRVKTLDGHIEPAPRLASEDRRRLERQEYTRERRREQRRALAGSAKEKVAGLRRQMDDYRAARAERQPTGRAVTDQVGRVSADHASRVSADHASRGPAGRQSEGLGDRHPTDLGAEPAPSATPPPQEAPPKRGLQFPDEF